MKQTNDRVKIHKFSNGMTLVAEAMPEVSSGGVVIMVPGGVAADPSQRVGMATVVSDLVYRGAGPMDSRTLNDRLDGLGLQRHSMVSSGHTSFGGALLGDNLLEAVKLHAEILQRPRLEPDQFEACRQLALQGLESLDDDPREKISLLTQEYYLPEPINRPVPGRREDLQALTTREVKRYVADHFTPQGTILAAAGKVDFDALREVIEATFGNWHGMPADTITLPSCPIKSHHQPYEGAQVHIGLMYPSVNYVHADYFKALAAVGVLSGGMGSRLFTEVREKRGLCYAVGAAHKVIGTVGAVQCYVGSSPEKAQEALDVTLAELRKLAEGITANELDRVKVGLRASLIMQGEASSARVMAAARDYYYLGRVRSLDEIEAAVLALTVDEVVAFAGAFPPEKLTVVTIGPKELQY